MHTIIIIIIIVIIIIIIIKFIITTAKNNGTAQHRLYTFPCVRISSTEYVINIIIIISYYYNI